MIKEFESRVLSGSVLTKSDALELSKIGPDKLEALFSSAEKIRQAFLGDSVDLCAIVNAKSGACPEDCAYCAQSSKSKSTVEIFPFIGKKAVIKQAEDAKSGGVRRFSIVTSGRKPGKGDLREIAETIGEIRKIGLGACASLGLPEKDELSYLQDHGLERLHNNLETSEKFFPRICTTHAFSDKLRTIEAARSIGLPVCSGGIFGMGETWDDRIDLALTLRGLDVVSIPVNFLNPIPGTRLDHLKTLEPLEALKVISILRFLLPQKEIRICGGRLQTLGELHSMIFSAGADSLMTGNYLVTTGRTFTDDLQMISKQGLRLRTS